MASCSPWGKVSTPAAPSLQDVMSEEMVQQIQKEDMKQELPTHSQPEMDSPQLAEAAASVESAFTAQDLHPQDTSNDLLLAQMLQAQFNQEHDKAVQLGEDKLNGQSKVRVSFKPYHRTHPAEVEDDDGLDSEEEDFLDEGQYVRAPDPTFKKGISGKGSNMVTKHDANLCNRRNVTKVYDQFPPGLNVGDSRDMDMKLSNKVYNKLKAFSASEEKKSNKLHEKKEHSTAAMAMDERTRILIYKMVNAEILEDVTGIISTGKEAAVLHATGGSGELNGHPVPEEVAIKVFKTTLTDFKNRADYVKGDVRFFKDEFKKQNPRKIMKIWAQKEEFNLRRLAKFIPVPKVVALRKHVLVMNFIGRDRVAAPKLKEATNMKRVDYEMAWDQVKTIMKKMYHDCVLVHADLSEYNLLWFEDTVYVIDVGQAVDLMHPHAHEFLLRDCRNMTQFFTKAGVADVGSEYELFNEVTGLTLTGTGHDFLMQIQDYEKNEEKIRTGKSSRDFAFDFFFDLSQKEGKKEDSSDSEEEDKAKDPSD